MSLSATPRPVRLAIAVLLAAVWAAPLTVRAADPGPPIAIREGGESGSDEQEALRAMLRAQRREAARQGLKARRGGARGATAPAERSAPLVEPAPDRTGPIDHLGQPLPR